MRLYGEALIALYSACTTQGVPVDWSMAVIEAESSGYVYALSGSYDQRGFFRLPKNDSEVIESRIIAVESLRRDINISVGLMQINSFHINKMGVTADWVFDPCNNIRVGTSVLSESIGRLCRSGLDQGCIEPVLREYNTGSSKPSKDGNKYVKRVMEKYLAVNNKASL